MDLRDTSRRLRAVQRELVPLTTGLVFTVKKERSKRLRDNIRLKRRSAVRIQARKCK